MSAPDLTVVVIPCVNGVSTLTLMVSQGDVVKPFRGWSFAHPDPSSYSSANAFCDLHFVKDSEVKSCAKFMVASGRKWIEDNPFPAQPYILTEADLQ